MQPQYGIPPNSQRVVVLESVVTESTLRATQNWHEEFRDK